MADFICLPGKIHCHAGRMPDIPVIVGEGIFFDCQHLTSEQYADIRPELKRWAEVAALLPDGVDVLSEGKE